jgi:hypothetical protein
MEKITIQGLQEQEFPDGFEPRLLQDGDLMDATIFLENNKKNGYNLVTARVAYFAFLKGQWKVLVLQRTMRDKEDRFRGFWVVVLRLL